MSSHVAICDSLGSVLALRHGGFRLRRGGQGRLEALSMVGGLDNSEKVPPYLY